MVNLPMETTQEEGIEGCRGWEVEGCVEEGGFFADGVVCGGGGIVEVVVVVVVDEDGFGDGGNGRLYLAVAWGELAEGD